MQYREYGNTGKMISALGFGAMRLPKDNDYAVEIMRRYLALGGNLIDTSRVYRAGPNNELGMSERLIGEAIKGRRNQVYLSTKSVSKEDPDQWKQDMEDSLDALGVDKIDFFHCHILRWEEYARAFQAPGGGLELSQKAMEEGIIDHLCFSSHDTPENVIKLIDEGVFSGMIVQYNLLTASPEWMRERHGGALYEEAIAHAAEKGMGVQVMGPLAGGRLVMGQTAKLAGALAGQVTSIADLGLRFVLANANVTCAMSGMNEMQQVEENCATASREEPLSDEELSAIREAVAENEKLAELYCTGCNYCQPCPQGVAIPKIFEAMNYHRVWGLLTEHAKTLYKGLGEANAEACIECGECEEKCPQDIPIIEQLKESHEALSDC